MCEIAYSVNSKSVGHTTWKVIATAKLVRTDKIERAKCANFVLSDMTPAISNFFLAFPSPDSGKTHLAGVDLL